MTAVFISVSGDAWVVFLYIGMAVIALAYPVVRRFVRNRLSDSWTQVQGTIEHTDVHAENHGKVTVQVAQISYSYRYEGEYYAGHYTRDFAREKSAYDFLDLIPKGTPVTIRCKPDNPATSVFREDDNRSTVTLRSFK